MSANCTGNCHRQNVLICNEPSTTCPTRCCCSSFEIIKPDCVFGFRPHTATIEAQVESINTLKGHHYLLGVSARFTPLRPTCILSSLATLVQVASLPTDRSHRRCCCWFLSLKAKVSIAMIEALHTEGELCKLM
jgi:hypothetical protein